MIYMPKVCNPTCNLKPRIAGTSLLYDDPWEGSGACPARWERPFYQGAQIYVPREYPVQPGCVRRSNPGEPQFGGEAGQDLAVKRGKDAT